MVVCIAPFKRGDSGQSFALQELQRGAPAGRNVGHFGGEAQQVRCRGGVAADHDDKAVRAHLAQPAVEVRCDLGLGDGTAAVMTADLGHGYIDENRTTS